MVTAEKILETQNETQFKEFAYKIASLSEKNEFIALNGKVGRGKTTFARFFIKYFDKKILNVPSPTFNLVFIYETRIVKIWHFDLYRLNKHDDVWEIGLEDALSEGIVLVEWPNIIKNYLPENRLEIYFEIINNKLASRKIILKGYGTWEKKLLKSDEKF